MSKTNKKFEDLNFDEIHKILHDNNEMFVGLVNVFIKAIKKTGNGFIVNVHNYKYETEEDMIYWDLLYYSTSNFSTHFTKCLRKSEPKVKAIDVFTNYNSLKKDDDKEKLCAKTFSYLGLQKSIRY